MSRLEETMVALCREVAELQRYGTPDVEFFWDSGMTAAFQITQVPTLRVRSGGLAIICDHEGVRR